MKNLYKFLGLFIISSLLFVGIAQAKFSDVNDSTVYHYAINWMANQGVIQGYSNKTFKPAQCVNRVEFLKMLVNTLYPSNTDYSKLKTIKFKDTDPNAWYAKYINIAAIPTHPIIQGYPDGTFKPAQCVNRAEAVKMTVTMLIPSPLTTKTASTLTPQFKDVFKDIDQSQWYAPYINFAVGTNILATVHAESTGDYVPSGNMTRSEVAEMLYRAAVMYNHDAIDYNSSQKDNDFKLGQKTTYIISSAMRQDSIRRTDLHNISSALNKYFTKNGNYPDAIPRGSCINNLSNNVNLSNYFDGAKIPNDPTSQGVGGCLINYMYCKTQSGYALVSVMNESKDGNALVSNFSDLTVCNGNGTLPKMEVPSPSNGPWVYALIK